ncbi:MAG: hypothetical protein EPN25_14140 [Nitrospirae bacterium]|nr:MAG: hypothetical protein EPN25_14140 [Nitrospirota bacterium]
MKSATPQTERPLSTLRKNAVLGGALYISLLAGSMIAALPHKAHADPQGKDMGHGFCTLHGHYTGPGCPRCNSGSGASSAPYNGPNLWNILRGGNNNTVSPAEQVQQQRLNEAHTANEQGVAFYNKGDWGSAATYFQEAANKNPDDPVIRQNLTKARANVASQQAREQAEREAMERQRQNKAAADNLQQSIQNFTQTLNAAPASGGLDFDGRTAGNSPGGGNSGGLDFTATVEAPRKPAPAVLSGDPRVVDARVTRDGDYLTDQVPELKHSPSADRITKGFQAVINHDWPMALAWWQDALNRDPNNATLRRSVDLAHWMVDKRKATAAGPATPLGAAIHSASRGDTTGAIRQFEIVKAENPAIAPQVDSMITALRQRQAKDANAAKVAAYWNEEINKQTQQLVDDLFETGMNRLSIGDEEGAQKAFNDATFFGGSSGVRPSQISGRSTAPTPTFIIGKDGQLIQVPENSDQKSATYIKGKDGKLIEVPQPSDALLLFPGNSPAITPNPAVESGKTK